MQVILIYKVDTIEQAIEIVSNPTKKCWLEIVKIEPLADKGDKCK